jgi:beta-lactamase class A
MKAYLPCLLAVFLFNCKPGTNPSHSGAVSDPVAQSQEGKTMLRKEIRQIIDSAKGNVGVAMQELEDGDTLSFSGQEHYPMQSAFKFPLAVAVLHQVDKGRLALDEKIHFEKSDMHLKSWSPIATRNPQGNIDLPLLEVLRYTITQSDNSGCDRLFRLLGGPDSVNAFIHSLGIKQMNIANTEAEMQAAWEVQYNNWSEPKAMLKLLEMLFQGKCLTPSGTDCLRKLMAETKTGAKRIKGLLPQETVVEHKTGTGPTNKEGMTSATNDAGIITLPNGKHLALVVFVSNSTADETTRERTIARIAKVAWDYEAGKAEFKERK